MLETATEGRILDDSTQQRIEAHRDQLEAYEGLCRELGANSADVALAWLLRNPVVSTTVVGATTIEELQSDLGALSVQLDTEVAERLDRIWPGPGEAPAGVRLVRPGQDLYEELMQLNEEVVNEAGDPRLTQLPKAAIIEPPEALAA